MSLVGSIDAVALLAFAVAFALSIRLTVIDDRPGMRAVNGFFAAAMGVYLVVSLSNTLEHMGVTSALDPIEDYLEVLFIPLVLYVATSRASLQDKLQLQRAYTMLESEHELLDSIIDASPTCIVVAENDGRISFANEHAKDILGLGEDKGHSGLPTPEWRLRTLDAGEEPAPPGRFVLAGAGNGRITSVTCALEWPDGRRLVLNVSSSPMTASAGTISATVYAFEEVTYRKGLIET